LCSPGDAAEHSDSSCQQLQQQLVADFHGVVAQIFLAAVDVSVCQAAQTAAALRARLWSTVSRHHFSSQAAASHRFLTTNSVTDSTS